MRAPLRDDIHEQVAALLKVDARATIGLWCRARRAHRTGRDAEDPDPGI